MNILIYVPYVDKSFGGVLQYSKCLISILKEDKKNNYFLFLRNNFEEFEEFTNTENFTKLPENVTRYRTSLFSIFELLLFNLMGLLEKYKIILPVKRPNVVHKVIKKYNIDILHCPYQHLPEVDIPAIATMHDLQELHFPEFFTPEIRAVRAVDFLRISKKASKIIVSYNHVKEDLIRFFNLSENEVEVVLLNMQNLWFDKFMKGQDFKSTIELPAKYILYPAATWNHKNHISLLKALKVLKEQYGVVINLVCTGQQTDYFKKIKETMVSLGLENQVSFLGKLSEEDLFYTYKNCSAIVIPTLYEAGSFPLMEGILMKIPCVCSNVTSLPETIDFPEYTFNPNDINDMAFKINKIVNDNDFREIELKHYHKLSKNLTNSHTFQIISYIYDSIKSETKNKLTTISR